MRRDERGEVLLSGEEAEFSFLGSDSVEDVFFFAESGLLLLILMVVFLLESGLGLGEGAEPADVGRLLLSGASFSTEADSDGPSFFPPTGLLFGVVDLMVIEVTTLDTPTLVAFLEPTGLPF